MTGCTGDGSVLTELGIVKEYPTQTGPFVGDRIVGRHIVCVLCLSVMRGIWNELVFIRIAHVDRGDLRHAGLRNHAIA